MLWKTFYCWSLKKLHEKLHLCVLNNFKTKGCGTDLNVKLTLYQK